MTSDVEVQNPAPAMLDYEEAIQELEGQRGHGKEIKGDDHFVMIGEEREPAFGWIAAAAHASKISGYSALGDFEPQLLQVLRGSWARPNPGSLPPGAES